MQHVRLETKEAKPAEFPVEIKSAIEKYLAVSQEALNKNEQRLQNVEKKFDDVITRDEQKKLDEALSTFRTEVNEAITELKRAPKGGDEGDDMRARLGKLRNTEAKAFDSYIRQGDVAAMRAAQALAQTDEMKAVAAAYSEATGIEYKDMSTVIAEDGGYLVQPEIESEMDEILLETSPMRLIANVRQIGAAELVIPVNRKGTTVSWIGETGTRTRTETPNISQERFRAHEIFALPLVTQAMLEDATFDVEAWLHDEVVEALMVEENLRFVTGDGNGKPLGFLHSSITKVADGSYDANTNHGSFAYLATGAAGAFAPSAPGSSVGPTTATNGFDALINVIFALKPQFRRNADWTMTRRTQGEVRKIKDGQGNYVIRDAVTESGLVPMLLGYPVHEFEDMPEIAADTYSIAFGDFNKGYQIVDRIGLQVRRDETKYPGFVEFQFRKRTGGGPRNYDAIKLLKFAAS